MQIRQDKDDNLLNGSAADFFARFSPPGPAGNLNAVFLGAFAERFGILNEKYLKTLEPQEGWENDPLALSVSHLPQNRDNFINLLPCELRPSVGGNNTVDEYAVSIAPGQGLVLSCTTNLHLTRGEDAIVRRDLARYRESLEFARSGGTPEGAVQLHRDKEMAFRHGELIRLDETADSLHIVIAKNGLSLSPRDIDLRVGHRHSVWVIHLEEAAESLLRVSLESGFQRHPVTALEAQITKLCISRLLGWAEAQ